MCKFAAWVDRLFNRYAFVRRLLALWAAALITWVTLRLFANPAAITMAAATAYATTVGLLGTALSLYTYRRIKDDDRNRPDQE